MHPVIIQAIATERVRDTRAHVAAAGRARQLHRARRRTPRLPIRPALAGRWLLPRLSLRTHATNEAAHG